MIFKTGDFRKIRISVFVCVASMAIGGGGIRLSFLAVQAARQTLSATQNTLQEADHQLQQARSDETTIREKSAIFRHIVARGILGEERRLEWIEQLNAVREKLKLINLQYELGPQQRLNSEARDDFVYFASPMRLRIDLLHEEDLIRFLDKLLPQSKALIHVRSCLISRLGAAPAATSPASVLQADCTLDWITLQDTRRETAVQKAKP